MSVRDNIPGGPRLPVAPRVDDPALRQVLDDHRRVIEATAKSIGAGIRIVADVELPDGVSISVSHGLGRRPLWVKESCVRGASTSGRVEEVSAVSNDSTKSIVLKATGWGATITVDVLVA